MKKTLPLVFLSLCSMAATAQAPDYINYQVSLRNGSGQALSNQSVTLRLGIYQGPSSTIKVYEETHTLTTNAQGIINCQIGKGTPTLMSSIAAINWGADVYNLKAEANSGGGFLDLGTQQIISVPYALYANKANRARVSNRADSSFNFYGTIQPGQIGSAMASNGQILRWNGSNWVPSNETSYKPGTGITFGMDNSINSTWTVAGNDIYNNKSGNVGIGVSTPAYKLDINGTVLVRNGSYAFADQQLGVSGGWEWRSRQGIASLYGNKQVKSNLYADTLNKIVIGDYIDVFGTYNGTPMRLKVVDTTPSNPFGSAIFGGSYLSSPKSVNTINVPGVRSGVMGYSVNIDPNWGYTNGVAGLLGIGDGTFTNNSTAKYTYGVYTIARATVNRAYGGYFIATNNSTSSDCYGVFARGQNSGSGKGYSLYVETTSGGSGSYTAYINGTMYVNGTLSKAGGTFKIDHPQDPENKYLIHSFVESPEMMNVYNGNILTGNDGKAVVQLPGYFETLNREFRYQLTVIGQPAQVWVLEEISENKFVIQSDKPNVKVSWQVTGVRQDPWAKANPIQVEQAKGQNESGKYLHPELYGKPAEQGIHYTKSDSDNIKIQKP